MTGTIKDEKYAAIKDEELVRLAQEGDDAAQEYLLDQYKFLVRAGL